MSNPMTPHAGSAPQHRRVTRNDALDALMAVYPHLSRVLLDSQLPSWLDRAACKLFVADESHTARAETLRLALQQLDADGYLTNE